LAYIGNWITPVFVPLGLADWRISTALLTGLVAKETVVSTMSVLLGGMQLSSLFSTLSAVSFLVFTLLYTPCVAAVATIRHEIGSFWKTAGIVVFQCVIAWICGAAIYNWGCCLFEWLLYRGPRISQLLYSTGRKRSLNLENGILIQ